MKKESTPKDAPVDLERVESFYTSMADEGRARNNEVALQPYVTKAIAARVIPGRITALYGQVVTAQLTIENRSDTVVSVAAVLPYLDPGVGPIPSAIHFQKGNAPHIGQEGNVPHIGPGSHFIVPFSFTSFAPGTVRIGAKVILTDNGEAQAHVGQVLFHGPE